MLISASLNYYNDTPCHGRRGTTTTTTTTSGLEPRGPRVTQPLTHAQTTRSRRRPRCFVPSYAENRKRFENRSFDLFYYYYYYLIFFHSTFLPRRVNDAATVESNRFRFTAITHTLYTFARVL